MCVGVGIVEGGVCGCGYGGGRCVCGCRYDGRVCLGVGIVEGGVWV